MNFDEDRPWVDVSPDLAEALNEWSQILIECWSAWRAVGRQMGVAPAPMSPVGAEDATLASIRPSWGPHETWQCLVHAAQLMDGASQHLLGLKALVDGHQLVLPPWPVVRAEIEHLARGAWILDPDVGPEARVARCWMERLHGAHRRKWVLDATRVPGPEIRSARRRREDIRAEVHRRFGDAELPSWTMPDKQPEWSVFGEVYPSIGRASRRFEEMGSFKGSHGMYDVLAATSHPNSGELSMITDRVEVDGRIEFPYRIGAEALVQLLGLAAVAMYRGAWFVCSYGGLDGAPLERWADRITEIAPDLLARSVPDPVVRDDRADS